MNKLSEENQAEGQQSPLEEFTVTRPEKDEAERLLQTGLGKGLEAKLRNFVWFLRAKMVITKG